jgi:hypothetical protein
MSRAGKEDSAFARVPDNARPSRENRLDRRVIIPTFRSVACCVMFVITA